MKATATLLLRSSSHQISAAPPPSSLPWKSDGTATSRSLVPKSLLVLAASHQPCLPTPVAPAQASPISPVLASDAPGIRI